MNDWLSRKADMCDFIIIEIGGATVKLFSRGGRMLRKLGFFVVKIRGVM